MQKQVARIKRVNQIKQQIKDIDSGKMPNSALLRGNMRMPGNRGIVNNLHPANQNRAQAGNISSDWVILDPDELGYGMGNNARRWIKTGGFDFGKSLTYKMDSDLQHVKDLLASYNHDGMTYQQEIDLMKAASASTMGYPLLEPDVRHRDTAAVATGARDVECQDVHDEAEDGVVDPARQRDMRNAVDEAEDARKRQEYAEHEFDADGAREDEQEGHQQVVVAHGLDRHRQQERASEQAERRRAHGRLPDEVGHQAHDEREDVMPFIGKQDDDGDDGHHDEARRRIAERERRRKQQLQQCGNHAHDHKENTICTHRLAATLPLRILPMPRPRLPESRSIRHPTLRPTALFRTSLRMPMTKTR